MSYELKDYLNSINVSKENLMESDDPMWEKKYVPFIINKCMAPFNDTIMLVNELNMRHHLDKKLQYDFLLNSVRSRKRYAPWVKASKLKDLEYVKEYYGFSNEKAKAALSILDNEQINAIKDSLNKGGRK
jgi:hypothetical protein